MGWSLGIKVFGVSLAGAQGKELHLLLCLPTEMFFGLHSRMDFNVPLCPSQSQFFPVNL